MVTIWRALPSSSDELDIVRCYLACHYRGYALNVRIRLMTSLSGKLLCRRTLKSIPILVIQLKISGVSNPK